MLLRWIVELSGWRKTLPVGVGRESGGKASQCGAEVSVKNRATRKDKTKTRQQLVKNKKIQKSEFRVHLECCYK